MKKILVPTDLSDISANALKLAVEIADKSNGEIYLVNFLDHPLGRGFNTMGEADQKLVDEENFYMIQLVTKTNERVGAMAAEFSHHHGEIHYEVFDEGFDAGMALYVEEKGIDLIVMGTTGEESAEEFFTGNHTERTIESMPCPVVSIKGNHRWNDLSRIVLGLDVKQKDDDSMGKAIGYINDLVVSLGAKVELVHVADADDADHTSYARELKDFAEQHGLMNYEVTVTRNDDKERGLIAFALSQGAGFLGVMTYAEGSFFRVFSRSTSVELSKEAQLPVLTINLKNI
ncbi:MAG: universal stress protein [Bacteroidota bacterium]